MAWLTPVVHILFGNPIGQLGLVRIQSFYDPSVLQRLFS